MKKEQTYAEFVAALSELDRAELTKLTGRATKQATEGHKSSVAAGETTLAVRNLLAKMGAKGQFSNWCREQKISRSAAYNNIRAYQWEKLVPDEFKAVAEKSGKALNEVAQNRIIDIALAATPGTVADAEKALMKVRRESDDPLADAVAHAADIIVKAYKGDLEGLSALANLPKYEAQAKEDAEASRLKRTRIGSPLLPQFGLIVIAKTLK